MLIRQWCGWKNSDATILPVIENNQLLGFISEEIILPEENDIEKKLSGFQLVGKECSD